jgi:predicted secreted Zn-dependent protease
MRAALLALSLLLPSLAHAAMYECRDANGRRTFSDTPCSPDAKVLRAAPPAGGASGASAGPGSLGTARIEYYDVSGASLDQLRAQMSARGTDGWAGHTHTHVAYHFTTQPTSGGCRVDEVTVTLDARVRLPRWVDRDAAPAQAQGEWDRLMSRLVDHEGGHVRIGQSSADAVERAVRETTPASSCQDVAARAKGRADAVLALLPQQQADYDARTDHGRGP